MKTYTIKQSNIAAIIHVTADGLTDDYIYMANGKPFDSTYAKVKFPDLPAEVQMIVHDQFESVFATPIEQRGIVVDNLRKTQRTVQA